MRTKTVLMAAGVVAAGTASAQQTSLNIHIQAVDTILAPGDSTDFHIWVELLDPTGTVLAAVSNISFDLTFGGSPLTISNNDFSPSFDSVFFGPAIDGVVTGDSIIGAQGTNTLPPLNNPSGVDSSNPLSIYSFSVDTTNSSFGAYTPSMTINNQFDGAYTGSPFPDVFFYQLADGSPGSVPFNIIADTIFVVPAPATGMLALMGLAILRRRSR
ncbi:MAG TPA: hypothetical protein ENJ00_08880 [Phycisphaerales bacterium]|nr:hypothetical protein [Phycisphaerales bacterium]